MFWQVPAMKEPDLYNFLFKCKLGVLGTIGAENRPQSALVGIAVTEDLGIVFDTVKISRKYGNLIARPDCSFAIGWHGEQTVQYEGEAEELMQPELDRCQEVYFQTGAGNICESASRTGSAGCWRRWLTAASRRPSSWLSPRATASGTW
jgi:hypothetical protein